MSAERAWNGMRELVLGNDRRADVSAELDMSFARVKALRYVAGRAMTGRELASVMGVDPPYVTVIVDDLEGRGLVERTPHPTDRRAKVIAATAAGRRAADKAGKLLSEPPAALRALPAEDLAALDRIVSALLDATEDEG
jgi:DNA-binding MarR family transcriptional regulator